MHALQLSLSLTAQICLDNAHILRQLTEQRWPDATLRQARACCLKSEEIHAAVVRMYLREVSQRQGVHGGGSGG